MSSFFGQYLKLSLFGQSHGEAIGITVDGLPAGLKIDMAQVEADMARRAPGQDALSTSRKEPDKVQILSGILGDTLTGQPLCAMIQNTNHHSSDYGDTLDLLRPGHADYTGHVRYYGFADFRGGGHFSGRLTAPIVFAGALCKQALSQKGIAIKGDILEIAGKTEKSEMEAAILAKKAEGDSVGGIIRCIAHGVMAGLGAPFFDSMESVLAHLLFAIPGVKGVVFGDGLNAPTMPGSGFNDCLTVKDGEITSLTNHSGGILGGITTGADIVLSCFMRPTPSIAKPQQTVSLKTGQDAILSLHGRHDPCIVIRAVPVVEAMMAIGLMEMWKERQACAM